MMLADLTTSAQKARLDIAVERGPPWMRPVYRAVRDHGLVLMLVPQGREPFHDFPADRPTVVIVGDDMNSALGPQAFHQRSLRHLVRLSCGGVIVASGPEPAAYGMATALAMSARVLLPPGPRLAFLIETLPSRETEWRDFVHRIRPGVTIPTWTVPPEERSGPAPKVDVGQWHHIFDGVDA